jgi:hypothetical protein
MQPVEIINDSYIPLFLNGQGVLKITNSLGKQVYMVITKEDFIQRIESHLYTPLLNFCSIYIKLAYIYGCLNHPGKSRDTTFTFWYRTLKTNDWLECFRIQPYEDTLFFACGGIV